MIVVLDAQSQRQRVPRLERPAGVNPLLLLVPGRFHDDDIRLAGQQVHSRFEQRLARVAAAVHSLAHVDRERPAVGLPHQIADGLRGPHALAQRPVPVAAIGHDNQVGIWSDAGERRIGAAVASRDAGDMRAVANRVVLVRDLHQRIGRGERGVELGLRVLAAEWNRAASSRRRNLVPKEKNARLALCGAKVGMHVVDAAVDDANDGVLAANLRGTWRGGECNWSARTSGRERSRSFVIGRADST